MQAERTGNSYFQINNEIFVQVFKKRMLSLHKSLVNSQKQLQTDNVVLVSPVISKAV